MIIDVSNTLPQMHFGYLEQIDHSEIDEFTEYIPRWANLVGWTSELYAYKIEKLTKNDFFDELRIQLLEQFSFQNFRNLLKESQIKYQAVHIVDDSRKADESPENHESMADLLKEYPTEFLGFAGFNPHKGQRSLEVVKKALKEGCYKGVTISPYGHGIPADDPLYDPLYELCEELGVPVWVHGSYHYIEETNVMINHPKYLREPLKKYPNLAMIVGHGGWPWLEDLTMLLIEYPNLYVTTNTFIPMYAPQTNRWPLFFHYANTILQNQILFSSDWLLRGVQPKQFVQHIEEWPLNNDVRQKFYWENAAKLFHLNLRE